MDQIEPLPENTESAPTGLGARRYAVVISRGASTYRATVPDLPGCAAVCRTRVEVEHVIRRAIAGHIRGLERQGRPVPGAESQIVFVEA